MQNQNLDSHLCLPNTSHSKIFQKSKMSQLVTTVRLMTETETMLMTHD